MGAKSKIGCSGERRERRGEKEERGERYLGFGQNNSEQGSQGMESRRKAIEGRVY